MANEVQGTSNKAKLWLKRVGWFGFLFFLLKGLVWLYLIYWAGKQF